MFETESFRKFIRIKIYFMLSINIPVYNIEVGDLVLQLQNQAKNLDVLVEIRVYDDCSNETIKLKNSELNKLEKVVYVELEKNLGRAAIRNKMGFESKYKYLLFIDSDSAVVKNNYLEKFLKNVQLNCVLCGGTAYSPKKPKQPEKMLRWIYGKKREAVSAEIRNNKKGFIITSNNFLIEKSVFKKFSFREDIKNYGHEDTLLGFDLFKNGIKILHLDNPLEHTGLEDSKVFLEKTKTALENLKFISTKILNNDKDFIEQVYFLNRYYKITKYLPRFILRLFFRIKHVFIEWNLLGKNPNLFWFDLYKLGFYSTLK